MDDLLPVAVVVQWIAILLLFLIVIALARQIGVLHERVAPLGALVIDSGPAVGDRSPIDRLQGIDGDMVRIGAPAAHLTLLLFVSPTCPICKKLIPIAKRVENAEPGLKLVFGSDGEWSEHERFARQIIGPYPYILSAALGRAFHIAKLPYAVLIDPDGIVRAKGLVNSREQLDSLLSAAELGVASAQQFVRRQKLDMERSNEPL